MGVCCENGRRRRVFSLSVNGAAEAETKNEKLPWNLRRHMLLTRDLPLLPFFRTAPPRVPYLCTLYRKTFPCPEHG